MSWNDDNLGRLIKTQIKRCGTIRSVAGGGVGGGDGDGLVGVLRSD